MPEESCCSHDACCGEAAKPRVEEVAASGCADCCSAGVPVFDWLDPRYTRVLWTVIAINAATWWLALRRNGIGDKVYGCGALLREH